MRKLEVGIAIVVVLVVVGLFFVFGNPLSFMSSTPSTGDTGSILPTGTPTTSSSGLTIQDTAIGTGTVAEAGETLTVNYTGTLADGTVFDTSVGKQPFQFVLGAGQVIPGWDQGLVGMKVGGERTLVIPPNLAYGDQAVGPIPANSTLTFDVTLLNVSSTTEPAQQ